MLHNLQSVLLFGFVLGLLVIVHEWGHYIAARWVGVRVEKFSIGFGPVIFGHKKGDTEFAVSLLPLGGFVKLAGESAETSSGKSDEFQSKSLGRKLIIIVAGPIMNAVLAYVLFAAIFMIGQPMLTTRIGQVLDGTPAQAAGMKAGDRVTAVNGVAVVNWDDVLREVHAAGSQVTFAIDRDGQSLSLPIQPRSQEVPGFFGKKRRVTFVGVAPASDITYVKSGPLEALGLAGERLWTMTTMILYSLGLILTGSMAVKDSLTGPIGIFFMTQQAAQMGAIYLFYFVGSLSVSLFVLNLLPIPVLDGGHLLFIVIEKLKGSPIRESVKERITQGGLVLLLALMAFVIFQDVHRFSILENLMNRFRR